MAACCGIAAAVSCLPAVRGEAPADRLILAHYMPWYEAKPTSPAWGWHWTMNAFDPETVVDGRRQIASKLYPAIGPYDSADRDVLEYHLLLMKLAGIDGVIVDWYGRTALWDYARIHAATERLVETAAKLGMKVAICYEDKTVTALVKQAAIAADARVRQAASEITWLAEHWFPLDAYAKVDGKPLLLSFGHEGLSDDEWERCLAEAATPAAYFSEHSRRKAALGGFDWPLPQEGVDATERFLKKAASWPARIPVAFPRFLDIYAEAKVHPSWGSIADDDGATFRRTLGAALEAAAPIVQIATWNDWGEGTAIEPSLEFGTRDLEAVQELRRRHIDRGFAGRAAHLELPARLLALRRGAADADRRRRLDGVAEMAASGKISQAVGEIDTLEGR